MLRKTLVTAVGLLFLLGSIPFAIAGTALKDEKKHTKLAKYVTAEEAYQEWKASPDKVHIIDVRTEEEYAFLGHAPMAVNIPLMFWSGNWVPERRNYALTSNPDFAAAVKKKIATDATIMVMCRSGHRSAAAVNVLAEAGFTNVFNIVDGFEGDMVNDDESYYQGKRMKNGWRNSNAPWTYELSPDLVYPANK